MSVIVAPSILAADLGRLHEEVQSVEDGGADWLHIDVMDGAFVRAITFGTNVVSSLAKHSKLFLDTHLMIVEPERHIEDFGRAGAHRLTLHTEACPHLHRALAGVQAHGMKAGVAVNPSTPIEGVFDVLDVCDLVLVMTVNPGKGGQPFLRHCLRKIERLRNFLEVNKLSHIIEVDGGIARDTAELCVRAGASALVAGTAIFRAADRREAIATLRI